ncbi:hypothetical protein AN191_08180 [Loktanella sp. 5RATIMAR09]|uniref:hypothetical protein n=1 Tax=Loktanella sp. 5RATIMAR09 TaxID=1225655 RepID=UPI000708293A|nr:hypothetical protein [Loktanella sp. 5RATIMAR09]KQI72409.1 hypothetical protein AN191_08180 [Loktanella sp. 5RATIMAR09]
MTNPNDDMLDDLLAQARGASPLPSDALMARVIADADAAQPRASAMPVARPGVIARMLDTIGGWPAVSGLAMATVAGIWVGVAPPASVQDVTAAMIGDEVSINLFATDLMIDAGAFGDG